MLCLNAPAKINWTLDILGVRNDGYHQMDMLMQSVSLCDTLWLEEGDGLSLDAVNPSASSRADTDALSAQAVPFDEHNLVFRAARALQTATGCTAGAHMRLLKRIPFGAGMGGGSADAAAALTGLNQLWGLGLSAADLAAIGLKLGADVPFMLHGGLARVSGIGEIIAPLHPAPMAWLTLVQPCDGLSTKEIFAAFDAHDPRTLDRPHTELAQAALLSDDLRTLGLHMNNVLETVSIAKRPAIAQAIKTLTAHGAIRAMMTGSGSVVYGVFDQQSAAELAHAILKSQYSCCIIAHTA